MQTPDEGNQQPPTGESGSSSPESSGGQQGQPLPEYVTAILERLDRQSTLIKGLQKGTDKQFGQIGADVKRILELREQGLTEPQILRELQLDRVLSGSNQDAQEAPRPDKPAPASGGGITAAEAIAQIERYNLPSNDSAVIALLRDPSLSAEKVKDFILSRVAPQPPASPATVTQPPVTSGAQGKKSAEQLQADYVKDRDAVIARTRPGDERVRLIAELKVKYREAGLSTI